MTQTVWVHTDRRGTEDKLIVFDSEDTADEWLRNNDQNGVAFAYPVITKEIESSK